MKQSHAFLNVSPERAKIRHQQVRRKFAAARTKHRKKTSILRQAERPEAYPTPSSLEEDGGDEPDVEEVFRHHCLSASPDDEGQPRCVKPPDLESMSLSLKNRKNERKNSTHDFFFATSYFDMPYYVETYQSKGTGVSSLLHYYLEVAGPTAMWRPQLVDGDPEVFMRSFVQFSMKEPIIFEAVVAISQAHLDLSQSPGSQPSTAVLQHRGKVLRMLQASLMSSRGPKVEDTALMAVFCMLVLDIMYRDWNSVKANMQGFRHMASLRGGIDSLGWQGWFRTCFSWAELRWAGHIAKVSSSTKKKDKLEVPKYPSHPFNPATCLSISRLPEGLREAALRRELSNEMIAWLEEVQEWTTGPHASCAEAWTRQPLASFARNRDDYLKSLRISIQGADILGKYALRSSERLLCVGVIAYIISADGSVDDGRQSRGLEDHTAGIEAACNETAMCDRLLWAGLAIAASTDSVMSPQNNNWVLLDRVLELDTRNHFGHWKDVKVILRKYFWNQFIESKWEKCWGAAISRKSAHNKQIRPSSATLREEFATQNTISYNKTLWPNLTSYKLAGLDNSSGP